MAWGSETSLRLGAGKSQHRGQSLAAGDFLDLAERGIAKGVAIFDGDHGGSSGYRLREVRGTWAQFTAASISNEWIILVFQLPFHGNV
jgi:hypothetical protein